MDHFRLFCSRFLKVPKGVGAKTPLKLRPWQVEAVRPYFEGGSKIHLLVIPRGNGKSLLIAALALYRLFYGGEGARVMIVAQNESAAYRLLKTAQRMVELDEELSARIHTYKDRLEYRHTDSTVVAVASEQSSLEGSDATDFIIDELGFTARDVYESALLSLKRPGSKMIGIGTPSTPRMRDKSPFFDLVQSARAGDPDVSLVEYSAPEDTAVDDWEAIKAVNPAWGDFLDPALVRAQAPPKTSEAEWRRARMGIWVTQTGESFMPGESWQLQARKGVSIPKGSPVVLALDGSHRWDASALVLASVSAVPHLEVAGWWANDARDPDFEVSHAEIEKRVLEVAADYKLREFTADPWGWSRSLQVLEDEGVKVTQFPQSGSRMPKALQEFRSAALDGKVTHADDPRLNKHLLAAQTVEGGHGIKLAKPGATTHIDGAVAATMAYSRAFWLGSKRHKKRTKGYKR